MHYEQSLTERTCINNWVIVCDGSLGLPVLYSVINDNIAKALSFLLVWTATSKLHNNKN